MENEKKYVKPEADIVVFNSEDIILTSDFDIDSDQVQQQLQKLLKQLKNKVVFAVRDITFALFTRYTFLY